MASGGRRVGAGRKPDENSARSERTGYKLDALPPTGYDGPIPDFPLPRRAVMRWEYEEKARYEVADREATERIAARELELWNWAWSTPQACAWSLTSEAWRLPNIAMWVRTFVICEGAEATAADKNSLHRFAEQIGLTTAGLASMGWKIAADAPVEQEAEPAEKSTGSSRGKLTVMTGGRAG